MEFTEYENKDCGDIINYFIGKNINVDIIKFMTAYAQNCKVSDFTDTTVDKSLNNVDYCPKYDRDRDETTRKQKLNDKIIKKRVSEIITNADFESCLNKHNEENTRAEQNIELLLKHIETLGDLREQVEYLKILNSIKIDSDFENIKITNSNLLKDIKNISELRKYVYNTNRITFSIAWIVAASCATC
jgi:hypothetical protein